MVTNVVGTPLGTPLHPEWGQSEVEVIPAAEVEVLLAATLRRNLAGADVLVAGAEAVPASSSFCEVGLGSRPLSSNLVAEW